MKALRNVIRPQEPEIISIRNGSIEAVIKEWIRSIGKGLEDLFRSSSQLVTSDDEVGSSYKNKINDLARHVEDPQRRRIGTAQIVLGSDRLRELMVAEKIASIEVVSKDDQALIV